MTHGGLYHTSHFSLNFSQQVCSSIRLLENMGNGFLIPAHKKMMCLVHSQNVTMYHLHYPEEDKLGETLEFWCGFTKLQLSYCLYTSTIQDEIEPKYLLLYGLSYEAFS